MPCPTRTRTVLVLLAPIGLTLLAGPAATAQEPAHTPAPSASASATTTHQVRVMDDAHLLDAAGAADVTREAQKTAAAADVNVLALTVDDPDVTQEDYDKNIRDYLDHHHPDGYVGADGNLTKHTVVVAVSPKVRKTGAWHGPDTDWWGEGSRAITDAMRAPAQDGKWAESLDAGIHQIPGLKTVAAHQDEGSTGADHSALSDAGKSIQERAKDEPSLWLVALWISPFFLLGVGAIVLRERVLKDRDALGIGGGYGSSGFGGSSSDQMGWYVGSSSSSDSSSYTSSDGGGGFDGGSASF